MHNISLHNIESIETSEIAQLTSGNYCVTLRIRTEKGESLYVDLYAPKQNALKIQVK